MKTPITLLLTILSLFSFGQMPNLGNNLLYHEAADGDSILTNYATKQTTTTYGIKVSKCTKFNGPQSVRFRLKDTDEMNNNGTRAEITFPTATNLNRWYSFAVYFPCVGWEYDDQDDVINQWHQGGGLTPALCIRIKKDTMYLRIMGNIWKNLGVIEKDKWHTCVMHVRHASDGTGLIEFWWDGGMMLQYAGQNMYAVGGSVTNPNWKLGVYKSVWNDNDTSMTDLRVIYFDDIKMGNENSTYREMAPNQNF